jgi:hypothetical protein
MHGASEKGDTDMTIISKFNGKCRLCGGAVTVGQQVIWEPGTRGVAHIHAGACASAPHADARPTVTANAKPMADFLNAAKARGLKFPKVSFLGPRGEDLTLKLAGDRSTNPGAVFVFLSGTYKGSIATDGAVRGVLASDAAALASINAIAADPAAAAKAYGVLTGNCSFCRKELTDAGSVEVGYGPVCARKYGLPHTPRGTRHTELRVNRHTLTGEINFNVDDFVGVKA